MSIHLLTKSNQQPVDLNPVVLRKPGLETDTCLLTNQRWVLVIINQSQACIHLFRSLFYFRISPAESRNNPMNMSVHTNAWWTRTNQRQVLVCVGQSETSIVDQSKISIYLLVFPRQCSWWGRPSLVPLLAVDTAPQHCQEYHHHTCLSESVNQSLISIMLCSVNQSEVRTHLTHLLHILCFVPPESHWSYQLNKCQPIRNYH